MKMKILSIVMLGSIASLNCSERAFQEKKIKIATASTLEARFTRLENEGTYIDANGLKELGIYTFLADKELDESELDGEIVAAFEQGWKSQREKIKLSMGETRFRRDEEEIHGGFMKKAAEIKPHILKELKQE